MNTKTITIIFILALTPKTIWGQSNNNETLAKEYYKKAEGSPNNGYLQKAAEQGLAIAQYHLGLRYYEGEGVLLDEVEAMRWWKKSAEQGCSDGQNGLGVCYMHGRGIKQNKTKAEEWWKKSAAQGNKFAKENLDYLYDNE